MADTIGLRDHSAAKIVLVLAILGGIISSFVLMRYYYRAQKGSSTHR